MAPTCTKNELDDNDQAPQFPPYIQFQVSAQNPQIPVQLSSILQDSGTGSMAGQSAQYLADSLQYNFGLMNTPPVVPGCSFDNLASGKDWHQSAGQDLRETMVHKMSHLIFPTPGISTFEDSTMINSAATEGDMYGAGNSGIEDGEIFASTNQNNKSVVFFDNAEKYNSASMFQHLEERMKKCLLDEKLKLMEQETTMNSKHSQKIIELSFFPLLDFLSTIINLRGLKKGESSVLDYSENLMYILEKLYLKMKIISQFQATVAACDELKESEKSEELEPDPFGYFVPVSSSKKNMEVYLTGENMKKTQELVCSLISAFKVIIWLYDEKNGYHLKSSSKSLPKQSEEDPANSSEAENVQSPGEEPVQSPGEESVQSPGGETVESPGEELIQSPDQSELLPEDYRGPSSEYQPGSSSEYYPGPSSEYHPGPSSEYQPQPGPSSEYQPQPGPSSEYQPWPGPSSEYQPWPGPSSEYQPRPGPSSEYQPQPGPSSEYQPRPGPSSEFQPRPGPSSEFQPRPGPSSEFQPRPGPSSEFQPRPGPSSEFQPRPGPSSEFQPRPGPSSEFQPWPGPSSEFQPRPGPSSEYQPWPGPSSEYQPWPGPSSEYQPWPGPSSEYQPWPGPSSEYQPWPGSSSEYQPWPGPSSEYQPWPGPSSEYQPWPGPSSEYQPGPSSEYQPWPGPSSEYQPGPPSPEYQHETSSPEYPPEALSPEYQPEVLSPEYQPEVLSPEYQPEVLSPEYQSEALSPEYQSEALSPEYQPEALSPENQPEALSPEYQSEASSPEYQPEASSPEYQPEASSPEYQPEASSPEYQPEASSPEYQPEASSPEEESEDTSDSCEVLDETAMEVSYSDDPPKSCSIPEVIPIEDAIITIETSESNNLPEEVQFEQAGCSYSSFQSCSMPEEEPMEEDSSEDSSKSLPQQSEKTPEPSPKEPKQLPDGCDFSKVKDLLYKFTKHALRALAVFSDPDIEYCFTEEVLSNEVVAAKNLALMYIIGPRRRIETVFPNILPVIFECLDKSSLVKVFTNNLLGHCRTSDSFSKALLQHFSNISLELMADDKTSSKQANTIIALFADMLKSFILFPDNIGKYHSACLDKNIKICIKLIPIAPRPMYFFRILKILYSAVFRNYEDKLNCCDSLCSMLSHVFQAFDIWLRRPVEHKTWIMILDTVLSISNSVSEKSVRTLLPYIETLCKCITFCIKENAEICLKALHLFERILQIDPINLSILPIKDNLLHVLYIAFKRPERDINDKVFTILGKLGSYNRDNFKYAHGLQEAKYSSLCLVLLFENYNCDGANSIEFSITKFPVDVAYSIITNPDEDIQRKKTCWSFVKEVLKVQMEIAEQSFNNTIVAESENEFCIIHKKALSIMFVAAGIDCLSEDAKAFKDKLILTYIIYSCIDQKDDRNHFFLILLEAAFETIGAILSDNKESVDISPLTSIISPLQMLSYGEIYACPFFKHVVINAVELCYKENWEGKYAGCKTIRYILEITDLEWKINHMWRFINPLLYSFADSNGKLSFGTSKEPIKTLKDMMKSVSECVACSNSEICACLVEALFSCHYCVRKEVRSLLNNLVQACKRNLHDVVRFPFEKLHETVCVVRFYEDFEFSNTLMLESYEDDMTGGNKKLYDDLKSLCNDISDIAHPLTPYSIILKDINMFCGALNALCFNFVNEITINELFGICLNALRSPVIEISEDASKCLKYIVTKFHGLEDIIIELVTDWVSNLFKLFNSKRDKCVLQEFLYFRQIIPHWPERTLFKMICEIFQIFVNLKAALLMFLRQEKQILDIIDNLSEKMHLLIEILNTLTLWKYKEEGKKSIIREVLSFVADLRPYRKLISVSRLRDPLLKFCRLHHFQALAVELHKKKTSFIFEELINFKNDTYAGSLYYETLLESSKPSEFLKILEYTSKYTPAWFEKKDLTLAKYLLQFHRNRYYAYISSESESSLKTFLFIKESKILVKCLTFIYMYMPEKVEILFELMTVFAFPFASQFQTLKDYVLNTVAKTFTTSFFEKCFLIFTHLFLKKQHQAEAEILEYIIIPSFFYAIRKGNCQHFFVSDNNVSSTLSVLDLFYACLWDVTKHTSKTQKAFMKLAVLFAEQIHLMDENTKKFFIVTLSEVLDMLNNFSSNYLLLATLVLNNVCLNNEMKNEVLKDYFDHFMEAVHDEEFVLEKFFYMYATKLPLNFVCQFCERIITHYSIYLDRILSLVFAFKKEFCDVAHVFLRHFMDFEWEWFLQDYQHINKVLKLIDVIMYPGRETIHNEFDDREISWIVNILLQHLSSQKISDTCFSLLKRILEGKIISNQGIYFDSALTSHLINVAEHPEIYEKCEIFKLMTEVLDYLPLHILELFVNNLHRCFSYYISSGGEITSSQLKVLDHMSNFLSRLTEKYPPEKNKSEVLEEMYNNISQLSVSDVTLQKAIVLEAVRPCFYLSTLKEYIAAQIGIMFDYYFNEKADILLRIKSLSVWLKILKKEEVFFEISQADRRLLLATFFPVIDRNLHAEIILEIVSIMDLFVKHLRDKRKISPPLQKKKRRKLILTFVYEVFVVLGKISSKVDSHFPDDEEINAKLFDVLLVFRENCGSILQRHDLEDDNFDDLQQSFKGIDECLKSQFKTRLLYVPGTLYHSANREKFFKVFAKEIQLDVSGVVRCIFENKFNLTISKSYIALCINLIAMKVKQVLVSPEEKFRGKSYLNESPDLFSSLVQLCYEDAFLAEHIWMHFVPAVLKMLENTGNAKAILDSDDAKAYINKISSNEYNIVPNPSDVFINGVVKAKPEFCLYADEKSIQRSYSFQVLTSQLLEKHLFQNCSSKTCNDYIKILNEVYTHMEESDLYYCFNQNYAKHKSETKSAMTKMQDINLCKSHELFKNLLVEFMSENSTEFSSSERMFCKNEFIKCSIELTKWNFFSHITNSMFLRDINIFSKWNIEEGSPTSTLKLQSNFLKCTKIDDSWKDRAVSKCMETLKVFPKFYNRRYYSLLELVQEITELIEAWGVQNNFKFHNMLETSKTIEDVYSKWRERRYLPSDDYQFLTEIFRIRLGFLKYFESRYSTKGNDLCIDDASRTAFENISIFTKNEINASIIELCSIALFCRNLHIINLKFDKYSNENALNLLQLKTLSLLHDMGPSSNSRFVIEENIRERVAYVSENCLRYLEPSEHEVIDTHMLDILRRFDQEQDWNLWPCKSSNAKLFEMHYEILEKDYNPRENIIEAASLMTCLLASCKHGSILNSMKLMPKILRILEYEDKDCLFPDILTRYKIPTRYWLPFLPFLVSRFLKALNPKYENSRMEVDGYTRPSLSYVLLNLLKEIGETYPQEIFFAVNSFQNIDSTVERTGFIVDDGEVELTQLLKSGKEKCEEIIASLKSVYPSLISHLDGFVRDFKFFKPTHHEINLTVVKELLDNVYCSLYENFKDGSTKNCSPEFTSYIRKALELLFALLNSSGEENSFDTSSLFSGVDCCSYASVLGALQALMRRFMHLSCSEKRSFYLDHNQPFITNFHHFEEDIYVFGQSSFVAHCSQIKILKFLPKVETQIFGDHHSYKISVLGHNGKVYSFILREEHFKEESMKRAKCMELLKNLNVLLSKNVQCAKRFFNFYFPTMITLDPNMILVPYQQEVLLYQDIMTYKGKARGFSPHLYFTHLLLRDPNAFENVDSIVSFIKIAHKEQSAYTLKCWVETLYPDHMDFYSFKKEFIKHLSMLIASEYFLNIAMKNELLVFKKNGIISVFEPRLNLKNMQNFSFMITPNICEFVGPLGLKLIAENVYWIASCFKENKKVINAYMHLLIRDYYLDKGERLYDSHEPILKKLDGLNREDILKFIELSSSTVTSCRLNPMIQPFF